MPWSVNGNNVFVAVVTFCIGVIAATFMTLAEPPHPAPNLFEPPVAAWDPSCHWVSYDQWRKMTAIREELKEVEAALGNAKTDSERIGLLKRAIRLQSALLMLMKESRSDSDGGPDGTEKLVIRQVCDEN